MTRIASTRLAPRAPDPWKLALWAWFALVIVLGSGPWSLVEAALCSAAVLVVTCACAASPLPGRRLPVAAWWWASGLAAVCVAQFLPLPWEVWSRLGVRADLVAGLKVAGVADGWRPFTLDPDTGFASFFSLAVPLAVWALFVRQAKIDAGAILALIIVAGVSSALMGFAQLSVGLELPWIPRRSAGAATGWFANRNMFAAQQGVTLALATHLALKPRGESGPAWLWGTAALVAGSALVLSQSRAGIVVGFAVTLAGVFLQVSGGWGTRKRAAAGLVIALAGVLMAWLAVVASDRAVLGIWQEQWDAGGRAAMWMQMPATDAWGVGLGAFAQWFQASPGAMVTDARVHHLHNDWLELWAELGVAYVGLGLMAFAGCYRAARVALASSRSGYVLPCLQGLACFGLLSLVDIPLRASSNLATFALLAALLLHLGIRRTPSSSRAAGPL